MFRLADELRARVERCGLGEREDIYCREQREGGEVPTFTPASLSALPALAA